MVRRREGTVTVAPGRGRTPSFASRMAAWLGARELSARRRAVARSPLALAAAAALFLVAFVLAVRALPDDGLALHPLPLALAAVIGVPATALVNGLEYRVSGRFDGHRIGVADAFEVAVLSSAANLLPVPGAAVVRARALHRQGSTGRTAVAATAAMGVMWLATSALLAGAMLVATRGGAPGRTGLVLLVAGAAALLVAVVLVADLRRRRGAGATPPLVAWAAGVEVLAVVVGGIRLLLVLHGIGTSAGLGQALALTVSVVLASAVGVLPGGLGVREALAGAVAPLVGLPAAVGVLATAVDRLVALPVLGIMTLALAVRRRRLPLSQDA